MNSLAIPSRLVLFSPFLFVLEAFDWGPEPTTTKELKKSSVFVVLVTGSFDIPSLVTSSSGCKRCAPSFIESKETISAGRRDKKPALLISCYSFPFFFLRTLSLWPMVGLPTVGELKNPSVDRLVHCTACKSGKPFQRFLGLIFDCPLGLFLFFGKFANIQTKYYQFLKPKAWSWYYTSSTYRATHFFFIEISAWLDIEEEICVGATSWWRRGVVV
jgi:hypothetical protein